MCVYIFTLNFESECGTTTAFRNNVLPELSVSLIRLENSVTQPTGINKLLLFGKFSRRKLTSIGHAVSAYKIYTINIIFNLK